MIRGLGILLLYLGSLMVILFLSAGRIDWSMGWASLGTYTVISIVNFSLSDPELVKERSQIRDGINKQDTSLAVISFLFFYPLTLLIAGLDVGRMAWTGSFSSVVQFIALLLYVFGNILGSWALLSNRYFSTFVRIQGDRGHEVVSSGPYAIIRHPGYAGTIIAAIALPISLGSLWALIPATLGAVGFVIRAAFEDRILLEELVGYQEYAKKVRYRLFPGLW